MIVAVSEFEFEFESDSKGDKSETSLAYAFNALPMLEDFFLAFGITKM